MAWWIKVAGTGDRAYTQERWDERRRAARRGEPGRLMSGRRPSIRRGDLLVVYATGSAADYGEGRFVAIEEVLSEEPEPSGHERWPWQLHTRLVLGVESMSHAPALRDIGVSPKSLRQHSHIQLTDEQGREAERLLRAAGAV